MNPLLPKLAREVFRAQKKDPSLTPADLDAYVRQQSGGKITLKDVQAYVQTIDTDIGGRNLARSAAQGALFNFGDELWGLFDEAGAEDMRTREELFRDKHPVADAVAGVGGALLVPGMGAAGAAKAAGVGGRVALRTAMGAGALTGAAAGALAGAGAGETPSERVSQAGWGAGIGGLTGGAIPAVAAGVKAVADPAARAGRRLTRAISQSGGTDGVRAAKAAMDAAGKGDIAMLADLSGPLRAEADFAANAADDVRVPLAEKVFSRQKGQSARLSGDAQQLVGNPVAELRKKALADARIKWAKSDDGFAGLREQNLKLPFVEFSQKVGSLLEQPKVRAAWKDAHDAGLIGLEPNGSGPIPFSTIHEFYRSLDDLVGKSYRDGFVKRAEDLKGVKGQVKDFLSKYVNGFDRVNTEYAKRLDKERAIDAADEWFGKEDTRGLAQYVSTLEPEALQEFRLGMASRVLSWLRAKSTNRNTAGELQNASAAMQDKLQAAFGSKAKFDTFMRKAAAEAQLAEQRASVGGSPTARRQQAAEFDPAEVGISAAAGGPAAAVTGAAARSSRGVLARGTARKIGPYLMTEGNAIEDLLKALEAGQRPGGITPFTSAAMPAAASSLFDRF